MVISGDENVKIKVHTGIGGKVCNNLDCPDNENGRCKVFVKGMRCDMVR